MAQYDKIAKIYFEKRKNKKDFDYNRDIEVPAMVKAIGNVRGKTILDMGCGFGDHIEKLLKQKPKKIIGFDLSPELIRFANGQKLQNCEFFVLNFDKKMPFKAGQFDIVFSSLAVHYSNNLDRLFSNVRKILKKNGLFLFSTSHPIFNAINTSLNKLVGIKKINGKKRFYGNYFDESLKSYDCGTSVGKIKLHSYTFQTWIRAILKNKFEIIEYIDEKPVPESKKYNAAKYKMNTTLPTFILFKLRKK